METNAVIYSALVWLFTFYMLIVLLIFVRQKNRSSSKAPENPIKVTAASSAVGFDFHPLLQRTDNVNCDSVAAHSAGQLSVNSESLRGIGAQFQNPFDAFQAMSYINSSPIATFATPSSPSRKSDGLDLDVQLSCTYSKSKAA
ncbi:unnamed protein product [Ilex paraguariensis]|uniref:ATP synthase F0 subunit 8 n=1 Tax=Ilex paraguariensis TaxID=185542 RepID=A0ABC8RQU6_9AQUA